MFNNEYHHEGYSGTTKVIVDLAKVGNSYEVMALFDSDGKEIESQRFPLDRFPWAAVYFRDLAARYPIKPAAVPKPLTGKYAKLRDDLKAAMDAGRAAEAENPDDGGTCNFDAAGIYLPRWRQALVEQAAEEAGTHCSSWTMYGKKKYVFEPDTRAHANARNRNAEAMTAALASLGYDAVAYLAMD